VRRGIIEQLRFDQLLQAVAILVSWSVNSAPFIVLYHWTEHAQSLLASSLWRSARPDIMLFVQLVWVFYLNEKFSVVNSLLSTIKV
jgi:hypothetical protein